MSAVTYITFFFDLYRRDPSRSELSTVNKYHDNWLNVLSLEQPLVIFCEPDYVDDFLRLRDDRPTAIVKMSFEELPYYRYYHLFECGRKRNPVRNANPIKDTIDYTILILSKQWFISKVLDANPFSSTHFALVDIGITHVATLDDCDVWNVWNEITDKIQTLDRVRVCCMRYVSRLGIRSRKHHYSLIRGHVCAGLIAGPAQTLLNWSEAYVKEFLTVLKLEIAPSDEQILGVLVTDRPELFDVYYGDYSDILINFVEINGDAEILLFNLKKSAEQDQRQKLIQTILETQKRRPDFLNFEQEERFRHLRSK